MSALRKYGFGIALLIIWSPALTSAQMSVHIIDVGEGESILIELPQHALLIDAGGETTGDERYRTHLLNYIRNFFSARPDLHNTFHSVIVTHPHSDHSAYLMDILKNFSVRNFMDGGDTTGSGAQDLLKARQFSRAHKITYRRISDKVVGPQGYVPDTLERLANSSSETSVRFLSGSRNCGNANNNSLVVLVTYHGARFLFPGDAETREDQRCEGEIGLLLERFHSTGLLNADVYQVSHHGSANGTSSPLLEAISPRISVISAGNDETRSPGAFHAWHFGHPRDAVISLLEQHTIATRVPVSVATMAAPQVTKADRQVTKAVYCTCWDGDIVVSVDASGSQFKVRESN